MPEKTIDDLIDYIFAIRPELKSTLIGCSEEEISVLEKKYNIKLPKLYRDFLLKMGHLAGGFLRDEYYEYKELMGFNGDCLQEDGQIILRDCGSNFILPDNSFVFLDSAGYAFWYFLIEENKDNPDVYFYISVNNLKDEPYYIGNLYDFYILKYKSESGL